MVQAIAALPRTQRRHLALFAALLLIAQVAQPYPDVAPLHHGPTLLLLVAAPWMLRRWPLSNAALGSILLFLALHTLGGRYTYSNVPYDAWVEALTGGTLSDLFGWRRNHYDRVVHFAFGLFSIVPAAEIARRWGRLGARGALVAALGWVLAMSSLYEIFEWMLTVVAEGETADRYNGQQGDMWDAQKDMALAALGAVMLLPFVRATEPDHRARR